MLVIAHLCFTNHLGVTLPTSCMSHLTCSYGNRSLWWAELLSLDSCLQALVPMSKQWLSVSCFGHRCHVSSICWLAVWSMHAWACLVSLEVAATVHASLHVPTYSFFLASPLSFNELSLGRRVPHVWATWTRKRQYRRRNSVDINKLAEMFYASSNSSRKTVIQSLGRADACRGKR